MQRAVRALIGVVVLGLALVGVRRLSARRSSTRPPEGQEAVKLQTMPLRGRLPLVVLPASLLAGAVFALAVAAPRLQAAQPPAPPGQPIAFDHRVHTQAAGLDCTFCHRTAATGVTAGLPAVELCMDCHQSVGQGQPEIEKVRMAWNRQQSIDWQLVNRVPDHTRFTHDAHIQAGIACSECHGDVSQMQQVVPIRSLKMADCVACHQQNNAPTECSTCHF